jgi:hypothetical protein
MIGDNAVASRFSFSPVVLASSGARTGLPATTGVTGPLSNPCAAGLGGDGGASGGIAESI